jgi:hypothetical protein
MSREHSKAAKGATERERLNILFSLDLVSSPNLLSSYR